MERNQRGTVAAGLLAAACLFGFVGYAAGVRADEPQQGVIRNGRLIQPAKPTLPDPAAQRNEMIAALHSLEQKLDGMQRSLDAIERHERNTYVLLGNQKVASPKE
ncbi:MAG: hypothetical protein O3A20_02875 [Planctomycetota bacterium]|nr:hypothetical protein [Planctomycetota bacterium]